MSRTLLVVSAHSADFVWRAAGAIAHFVEDGGTAHVVALSYGERGESGELWKEPGQTEERVKEIRHGESTTAAAALGADFRSFDLGDYPLVVDAAVVDRLRDLICELAQVSRAPSRPSRRPSCCSSSRTSPSSAASSPRHSSTSPRCGRRRSRRWTPWERRTI